MQTDFRTLLEVSRAVGHACGSTAWLTSLLNANAWFVGLFPAQAQDDVWAHNPGALVAGVVTPSGTARVVEGGYRVSGRWAPASGCAHADWAVLGVTRPDAEGTSDAVGIVLAPMSELAVEDTWFVAGMRGTASNTLVGEDLFVPAHRFHSVPDAIEGRYATLHRRDALPGTLRARHRARVDRPPARAGRRRRRHPAGQGPAAGLTLTNYTVQAEAPTIQLAAANAASHADSAQLHAYRAADDLDDAARTGSTRLRRPGADTYGRGSGRGPRARGGPPRVLGPGRLKLRRVQPLQRVWRDIETASRHAVLNPEVAAEIYGKSLFGIQGTVSALV
ncbi:oxidoreductase [Streptomyces sp. M19]